MPATVVVLTGPPGVGKTTLVKKVWEHVTERHKKVPLLGFITEELRNSGLRVGFKVVTTQGREGRLASVDCRTSSRVGRFGVDVKSFEDVALPSFLSFSECGPEGLLLLDEIGRMEMYSAKFKTAVEGLLDSPDHPRILATIPSARDRPIEFVEKIRERKDISLISISKGNRDQVLEEILQKLGFDG